MIRDREPTSTPKVPAVDHALRMLLYISAQAAPVSAQTLSREVGMPRSTTYHLLGALRELGFVFHHPETHRWGLGWAALELASGYMKQAPITRLGRSLLAQLSSRSGEVAFLVVLIGRDVLHLAVEKPDGRSTLDIGVGTRLPAHLSAAGRAILAEMPKEYVRSLYPNGSVFANRTGNGPASPGKLKESLRQARTIGYAVESNEVATGCGSIGVAVRNHAQWPIAAVGLMYPDTQEEAISSFVGLTQAAARELCRRIEN